MYSSSEEVDQPDQSNGDHLGTGRSYECVFCKRGFTTAQALGGHMNIHRKDRATKKPTPPATTKVSLINPNKNNGHPRINGHFHQPVLSYPPSTLSNFVHYGEAQIRYESYFPASSTSSVKGDADDKWMLMSSMTRTHQIHVEDEGKVEKGGNEGDGLDLELRLGYKQ